MRKISWMLLALLVFSAGCQDQPKVEQKPQPSVAEPPKGKNVPPEKPFTTDDPDMKEVIWKKDGAKMVLIPEVLEVTPSTREIIPTTYDKFGDVVRLEWDAFLIDDNTGTDDAYLRLYAAPAGKYSTLSELESHNIADSPALGEQADVILYMVNASEDPAATSYVALEMQVLQWIGKPVVVTDYPKEIKAFYMRANADDKTVRAMDVLVPRIGEIIGGSQREERRDILLERMKQAGMDEKEYWWYLDLRQYGTVPHAGFGLGFEHTVQFITGMQNIRDIIPFPRTPKNAEF